MSALHRTVVLSDTRKVSEATQMTKEECLWDETPSSSKINSKVAFKSCQRSGLKRNKARREDTPGRKGRMENVHFHTDIVEEILLRLPIEALLRCRSVCKTWYSITKDPGFITKQMNISSKQTPRFICRTLLRSPFPRAILNTFLHSGFELDQILLLDMEEGKTREMPLPEQWILNRKIKFSHNGLLCLAPNSCSTGPIAICNPITKECIELPKTVDVNNSMNLQVGLCYVPARQEHIVVQSSSTLSRKHGMVTTFHILTSGQRSWRLLTPPAWINNNNDTFIGNTVYCNNVFYWKVTKSYDRGVSVMCMLSFDTIQETFRVVPLPDLVLGRRLNLLVLNGRLTLIGSSRNEMKLWEVKGDKVGEFSPCREIYDINTSDCYLVGRLNENENLMNCCRRASDQEGRIVHSDFVIVSNDLKHQKTLTINGLPTRFETHDYNPSLCSVYSLGFPENQHSPEINIER